MELSALELRPAGYTYLLERFGLIGVPNWHISYVSMKSTFRSEFQAETIKDIYPAQHWPGEKQAIILSLH